MDRGDDHANKRVMVGLSKRLCLAELAKSASWKGQGTWLAIESRVPTVSLGPSSSDEMEKRCDDER